jgi:hypothetical protein
MEADPYFRHCSVYHSLDIGMDLGRKGWRTTQLLRELQMNGRNHYLDDQVTIKIMVFCDGDKHAVW